MIFFSIKTNYLFLDYFNITSVLKLKITINLYIPFFFAAFYYVTYKNVNCLCVGVTDILFHGRPLIPNIPIRIVQQDNIRAVINLGEYILRQLIRIQVELISALTVSQEPSNFDSGAWRAAELNPELCLVIVASIRDGKVTNCVVQHGIEMALEYKHLYISDQGCRA